MDSLQKRLIFKKYIVGKLIKKTRISSIYEGINKINKEHVAMKFEKIGDNVDFLEPETYFLLLLKGIGIPNVISYGKVMNYKVLIEELLGKSVFSAWKEIDINKDILKDVCLIAIQCLDRIEYVHSKNIVHKDIKPNNFIFGRKDPKLIYIIDFGMSRKYRSSRTGKHIKFQKVTKINGTMRYISIYASKGYEHGRRDDLESLGYMIIYLMKNDLPWLYVEKEKMSEKLKLVKVCSIKMSITPEKLCQGLPNEFSKYIDYCRKLDFEQEPDYNYLRNLFISVLISKEKLYGLKPLDCKSFSWFNQKSSKKIKENIIYSSLISDRIADINKRKNNGHKRLYNFLKNSLEKKRRESSYLTESDRFNSDLKKIDKYSFSKSVEDINYKIINGETALSNTNDSNMVKKINKNILDDIKKINQIVNKKNIKCEKIKIKNLIKNNPKLIKKFHNIKNSTKKTICLDINKKLKLININNQKKHIKYHINADNNFILIDDNTVKKQNIRKPIQISTKKPNINSNLQKAQYKNKRNLAKTTNHDLKKITHFPNKKNQVKNLSLDNMANINSKLVNDIHYKSIIKRERTLENLKDHHYIPLLNKSNISKNFKIEYNFRNINNFYFNKGFTWDGNKNIYFNNSYEVIDQIKHLNTTRNNKLKNYKNYI